MPNKPRIAVSVVIFKEISLHTWRTLMVTMCVSGKPAFVSDFSIMPM